LAEKYGYFGEEEAERYGTNGCTMHTFFSVAFSTDDNINKKMKVFDDSEFDVIVFDEIFFR
jgi:superfamily II DNA or RNA helicase